MSTETFSRSFRGYRRSEVDTAKMRSDLRIEQLEYELSNMTQRANAMQVEIRDLYGRIDGLRERENSLSASLDEMRARRDQMDREAETRARQLMLAAEERSATLKTEGLRQVGELQRQVEQQHLLHGILLKVGKQNNKRSGVLGVGIGAARPTVIVRLMTGGSAA